MPGLLSGGAGRRDATAGWSDTIGAQRHKRVLTVPAVVFAKRNGLSSLASGQKEIPKKADGGQDDGRDPLRMRATGAGSIRQSARWPF